MLAADGWTVAGVVIAGLSLGAVLLLGKRSLEVMAATLEAARTATKVAREAAATSAMAAQVAQQAANAACRDAHRQRLEHVLDMIERIEVLARRRYLMEAGTQRVISIDDDAEPELLAALVTLRNYLEALPDELPAAKDLALQGGREIDAQRIQGLYLHAVTDVRNALVALVGTSTD
jgi:uncharacterized protein YPO0396